MPNRKSPMPKASGIVLAICFFRCFLLLSIGCSCKFGCGFNVYFRNEFKLGAYSFGRNFFLRFCLNFCKKQSNVVYKYAFNCNQALL